jgi:hypothetical protein
MRIHSRIVLRVVQSAPMVCSPVELYCVVERILTKGFETCR